MGGGLPHIQDCLALQMMRPIFSDIMTHLLPFPSDVAVGVVEEQADYQLRQRPARLGGQRLPLWRLLQGVVRDGEQIELKCLGWRGMDISPIRVASAQCCARFRRLRWGGRGGRHIPQQRRQGAQHSNIDAGSSANPPGDNCRPIEHPSRHFQPTIGCPTRETATENISAGLLDHLMNMHQASGPRMPRIRSSCSGSRGRSVVVLYNTGRPHSALDGATPREAYRAGRPVDMMDKARASPTSPQALQQQKAFNANVSLAA